MTILAERPGVYGGVCAEFCGYGHTGMVFDVMAHEADAYLDALSTLAAEARGEGAPDGDVREARR